MGDDLRKEVNEDEREREGGAGRKEKANERGGERYWVRKEIYIFSLNVYIQMFNCH